MSKRNYGKDFEKKFKEDFMMTFPGEFVLRLKDNTSKYKSASRNPCDFICHADGKLYMVETKCHYGNTFPFSELRQFYELNECWGGLKDVRRCVIIWFIDHSKVICAPISAIARMKDDGLVSININKLDEYNLKEYNILELESAKKRVFLDTDYSRIAEVSD